MSAVSATVIATSDHKSLSARELEFVEGNLIRILEVLPGGWLRGELNGKTGMFPRSRVKSFDGDYRKNCSTNKPKRARSNSSNNLKSFLKKKENRSDDTKSKTQDVDKAIKSIKKWLDSYYKNNEHAQDENDGNEKDKIIGQITLFETKQGKLDVKFKTDINEDYKKTLEPDQSKSSEPKETVHLEDIKDNKKTETDQSKSSEPKETVQIDDISINLTLLPQSQVQHRKENPKTNSNISPRRQFLPFYTSSSLSPRGQLQPAAQSPTATMDDKKDIYQNIPSGCAVSVRPRGNSGGKTTVIKYTKNAKPLIEGSIEADSMFKRVDTLR